MTKNVIEHHQDPNQKDPPCSQRLLFLRVVQLLKVRNHCLIHYQIVSERPISNSLTRVSSVKLHECSVRENVVMHIVWLKYYVYNFNTVCLHITEMKSVYITRILIASGSRVFFFYFNKAAYKQL